MKETIHIYHTNDLHSHFENWPRIISFLKERKAHHEKMGEDVFIFDIGDFADRYHPFTEGSMGKGNTLLLNELPYSAVTIGNNEGITFPHEHLDALYEDAAFDVIAANLYKPGKERPKWLIPYKIYQTKAGTKIGVTAVTTYYQKLYQLLGWELTEPFAELKMQFNHMKDQVDILIVLSHLGIHDDEKMTELFPEIDLILGAHTHHYFPAGKELNHTFMAAAGKYGYYVGHVQIHNKHAQFFHLEAELFDTHSLPAVTNEEQITEQFQLIGKEQLGEAVVHLDRSLDVSWQEPSTLPTLLCEAVHEWCQPDCTFLNSGLVLTSLKKGKVTKFDLHQMLPHPINPCIVELSGAQLKEILLHTADKSWPKVKVIGLGFRGEVMGAFVYQGIEMDKDQLQVWINGELIDLERIYKVGTVDMFTFGKFFPEIQRSSRKHYFMPEFLRDVMAWKLKRIYS